ncbi:phage protein NinX family protein [Allopusillimonas ginsengisoli]|uniref:phage protein NinX family protein n=1 Tax=Allopusillimonas ginsengisoli TaxID=453575 RepID=UPI0039C27CC9
MKMKVDDLIHKPLNWAVAQIVMPHNGAQGNVTVVSRGNESGWIFRPSEEWQCGGPLLFNWGISTILDTANQSILSARWKAMPPASDETPSYGPDQLVAGMRCLVRQNFGDEIDIPDALLS